MNNYLEKLLCVEVLERIARFRFWLQSEPIGPRRQGTGVVSVLDQALSWILDDLKPIISRLEDEAPLDELEKVAVARALSTRFLQFDKLHRHLEFLHGTWVRPETNIFIQDVLAFFPEQRRPTDLNVIFSNRYSFLEADLASTVEVVLGIPTVRAEGLSVFLPKIERDNPLNWANLVHECGHADRKGLEDLAQSKGIVPTDPQPRLVMWVQELYCDLFAARILGPAYLASLATLALVGAGTRGLEETSDTHPPDSVRTNVVYEVLRRAELAVPLEGAIKEHGDDISSLYCRLVEERASIDRRHLAVRLPERQSAAISVGAIIDTLYERVEAIICLREKLEQTHLQRIRNLKERLTKSILIGSYQVPEKVQVGKKDFPGDEIPSSRLGQAKELIQESPVLLWEILNAGWLHKVEETHPRAFKRFFDDAGESLDVKLAEWSQELQAMDGLLLKSIEASKIHELFKGPSRGIV